MKILRLAALAALFSLCAIAQTTVTGTLVTPTGDRVSGDCTIQSMTSVSTPSGLRIIPGASVTVHFTAGLLSISLLPTDTAVPGGAYDVVKCAAPVQKVNGRTILPVDWPEKIWRVPTSATPVDVSAVEVPTIPAPSGTVNITQISGSGLPNGCLNNSNGVISVFTCGAMEVGLDWTQWLDFDWTSFQ